MVPQRQLPGMQPQPLHAQQTGDSAVQSPFAMRRVANNGVRDVLHMPAQLVPTPGLRLQRHERAACGGKAARGTRGTRSARAIWASWAGGFGSTANGITLVSV